MNKKIIMSRRTKQAVSVLAGLATLSLSVLFSSSAITSPATDQTLLSALSEQYFKSINSSWVEKSSPTNLENDGANTAIGTTALLRTRLSEKQQERQELAKDGILFGSSDTTTQVNNMEIEGDKATVRATVSVRLTQSNPAAGAPSESSYTDDHVLTYRQQQGIWKLESDIVVAPPSDTADLQELPPKITDVQASATERPITTPQASATERPITTLQFQSKQAVESASATTTAIPPGLNYQAMVNYAIRWAGDYNPIYYRYGNDCTNFISQALYAGGWPLVFTYVDDARKKDKWNYETYIPGVGGAGPTYTWRIASYLYDFSIRRTNPLGNIWNGNIGDLLFVDWDPNGKADGTIDHVMMVTGRDSGGMVYISQHSPARNNIPLSMSIRLAKEQGKTKIVWHGRRT